MIGHLYSDCKAFDPLLQNSFAYNRCDSHNLSNRNLQPGYEDRIVEPVLDFREISHFK
jgi:hypothetical protein